MEPSVLREKRKSAVTVWHRTLPFTAKSVRICESSQEGICPRGRLNCYRTPDQRRRTMRIKNIYERKKTGRGKASGIMAAVFLAAAVSFCCSFVSLADSTGTVTVESARIRKSADADSEVVASVARGKKVTIKDEVQDAAGTFWYQVYVDADNLGYVRADLIEKEGGSDSSTAQMASDGGTDNASQSDGGQENGQGSSGAEGQAETPMDAQYASVSVETAKIRSAPSTNDSVVEKLARDTQVVVHGQSNGSSDGKVWYYVTFTGADGAEKAGYVRYDLVTLGDMVPVAAQEPAPEEIEAPEPQEAVSQDYEVVFKNGEWYLLDHLGGYEQPLQPLLDANQMQNDSAEEDAKKLVRQRIAIVALAALAVILIIVVIVMAVKLRDAYYEDYEDDEEEDEEEEEPEEEEAPVRRRRRVEDEDARESERTAAARRAARETETRSEQTADTRVKHKAKNFLLDDDEFEFEFLNMDDKDL